MRYNDEIRIDKKENRSLHVIMDRINRRHPECAGSVSTVTVEFIHIVSSAICDEEAAEGEEQFILSDHEAREVLKRIPADLMAKPFHPDTINAILEISTTVLNSAVLDDAVFSGCDDAASFSNRASNKMELGLSESALEDQNRACELETENADNFILRASIRSTLGRRGEALEDAMTAFGMNKGSGVSDLMDALHLSFVFNDCGSHRMTVLCLLKYIEMFRDLLPHATIERSGLVCIEKDGEHYLSSLRSFGKIFDMIAEMEAKPEMGADTGALLEKLKNDICLLRLAAGF